MEVVYHIWSRRAWSYILLVIEVFNPFTFNFMIDVVEFVSVILLFVFYMSYFFLVPLFFHYCLLLY